VSSVAPTDELDFEAGLEALGYDAFRPGQREAVETLLRDGRLLLVAPTGGGKSLTYQLPASLLPGTTLVVSPLISLMHDQVLALEARGMAATYLASTLDADELRKRMQDIAEGRYKIVYAAPERLVHSGFRALLRDLNCPLVAIDEAHCISEWGHDFRPEYMQIGELLKSLPQAHVLACTATATPIVRDEILDRLGLPPETPQLVRGFARPNLSLRVAEANSRAERNRRINALLAETLVKPGAGKGTAIIYAPTRKNTEEEAARLAGEGWRCKGYHAGMEGETRDSVQRAFADGQLEVVVATNAFGMGIDRSDVRAIGHLAPPGSVEAYYQEVGRAGRDGEDAACLLLIGPGDMALRRNLIDRDRDRDAEASQHKWNMFLELMRWSEGGSCRHDAILRYFGDEEEVLSGCGRCDICRRLTDDEEADPEEVSVIVRKALCAVARLHGIFGLQAVAKLLHGTQDKKLVRAGFKETRSWGILSEYDERWILQLLRRLITAGWVDFHGGDRPLVVLTEAGNEVIHEKRPARLLLPPRRESTGPIPGTRFKSNIRRADPTADLDSTALDLFEELRRHRMEVARDEHVPPYVVASDRTLRDIALLRPISIDELKMAHGIGPSKAEKYGDGFLQIVRQAG
jgi:ATP-dependent DNA helicase RecQ